jgi:outer membrane protein assembly factor BamB
MEDGSVVWNKGNGLRIIEECPTLVIGDKAVIALYKGKILCVNAQTGDEIWSFVSKKDRYDHEITGLLAGQKMIFSNTEHVTALDYNGKIVWQSKENYPGQMAFVTNHLVIAGSKGIFCLNPKNGNLIWKNDQRGTSPAIFGTKVVVPINTGVIYSDYRHVQFLSIADGKETGRFDIPKIEKHPETVIGAGMIFIGRPWSGETLCYGDKK